MEISEVVYKKHEALCIGNASSPAELATVLGFGIKIQASC